MDEPTLTIDTIRFQLAQSIEYGHQLEEDIEKLKAFKSPHNCGCGADSFATRCNECGGYRQIGHGG